MSNLEKIVKRSFDIACAITGIALLFIIVIISFIVASIETRSSGFFIQARVGKDGKLFNIVKIKTMYQALDNNINATASSGRRITKSGAFFRKTKIDELPQLWNVLVGHMSFVGPRPDIPGYADKLEGDNRKILSLRPGITGPAQLIYRNEEDILAIQPDPIKYNDDVIWPKKVKINIDYLSGYSFYKDLYYIWKTITGGDVKY